MLNENPIETFSYDANGNRLSYWSESTGTIEATYDNQDRIKTYGSNSYIFTQNGSLSSKTNGSDVTTYEYDEFGSLRSVILPDSTEIEYVIDPAGRRIGKKVDEVLVQGFLYEGIRPVVELDGSGNVVSRFVYGTRGNVPDFIIQDGVAYRIITDIRGSVRLVVNTSTGAIIQQIDYDTFGNILSDTSPGFQPFGFAGGLYDPDTNLVRFGARDYDPEIGRWTSKDPILFAGGDTNLYVYCGNDAVNYVDPSGLIIVARTPEAQAALDILYQNSWMVRHLNDRQDVVTVIDSTISNISGTRGAFTMGWERSGSFGCSDSTPGSDLDPPSECNNNSVKQCRETRYNMNQFSEPYDYNDITGLAIIMYHELTHIYLNDTNYERENEVLKRENYIRQRLNKPLIPSNAIIVH